MSMLDRENIVDTSVPKIISNIVRVISVSDNNVNALQPFLVLSTAFWLIGLDKSNLVIYHPLVRGVPEKPTKKAQQIVAYLGMTVMVQYIKNVTKENLIIGKLMWKDALASKNICNLLTDLEQTKLWNLATNSESKSLTYRNDIRDALLNEYLQKRSQREKEIPLVQVVMEQFDIVYESAYVKPVTCMRDFIRSRDQSLKAPAVIEEAKKFITAYKNVENEEGANFLVCKQTKFHSKYPELNCKLYPNLYAVSNLWDQKTKET